MGANERKITTVNREGFTTILVVAVCFTVINILLFIPGIRSIAAWIFLVISIGVILLLVNFFRNPNRHFPSEDRDKVMFAVTDMYWKAKAKKWLKNHIEKILMFIQNILQKMKSFRY